MNEVGRTWMYSANNMEDAKPQESTVSSPGVCGLDGEEFLEGPNSKSTTSLIYPSAFDGLLESRGRQGMG